MGKWGVRPFSLGIFLNFEFRPKYLPFRGLGIPFHGQGTYPRFPERLKFPFRLRSFGQIDGPCVGEFHFGIADFPSICFI